MESQERISVIGGGAAGCFASVCIKRRHPDAEVTLYEASGRLMSKLLRTGGGRCNISNTFENVRRPGEVYPRGEMLMKRALNAFSVEDTLRWFEAEGLRFKVEDGGRIFPASDSAADVVNVLLRAMQREGVKVRLNERKLPSELEGKVLLASGGMSLRLSSELTERGIAVIPPVPSLFTLRLSDASLRKLSGLAVKDASLALAGTGFKSAGDLLITDWGLSGPATLRLSSLAARHLASNGCRGTLLVNWTGTSQQEAREILASLRERNPRKQISNSSPEGIASRLWEHILSKAGIPSDSVLSGVSDKALNRLSAALTSSEYTLAGKADFKEEFVTCGGINLEDVNLNTLESKSVSGLFFAGEVLDVDAFTGGFNLQAAWSTAWVASNNI